jgi:hypothetical protein
MHTKKENEPNEFSIKIVNAPYQSNQAIDSQPALTCSYESHTKTQT